MASDPRRVQQDTSYSASGLLPQPQTDVEHGSARYAELRSPIPDLVTPRSRILTFDRMANSDAAVDASLRGYKCLSLGAEYFLDAYSNDPLDEDVNEFCYHNIFERLTSPFPAVLEDIHRMCEYGYSIVTPVWEQGTWAPKRAGANTKSYTMLRKLAPRPTPTIKEILYDDNGGPAGIVQMAINSKNEVQEVPIKIDDLIIFTHQRKGGNIEGKSILRTAYAHWVYKQKLYKIDAIQKERHALGVPQVKLQPGYTPADKAAAHELGRNLRTNEWAHMVLPPNLDVVFMELHGNMVDVVKSIDHHNSMIMLNVMLEFLLAGIQASGSGGGRATSASQIDMFMKASEFLANLICSAFNQYLIPKLVGYNFKVNGFPQLKARKLGDTRNAQQLAAALANLAAQHLITMDDDTEAWVRNQFDMPKFKGTLTAEQRIAQLAQHAATQNGKGNVDGGAKSGNMGVDTQQA